MTFLVLPGSAPAAAPPTAAPGGVLPFPVRRDAPALRWLRQRPLRPGGEAWRYLTVERRLPCWVVRRAAVLDQLRDGHHAAWFAHRDPDGRICGAELRGPAIHLCIEGSIRTLFRFRPHPAAALRRLVVCESAIDALSVATLDAFAAAAPDRAAGPDTRTGPGTSYVSTAGGLGSDTVSALDAHLRAMQPLAGAELVIATDADRPGNRLAATLRELAARRAVPVSRLTPPGGAKDFNQVLRDTRSTG